MSVRMDNVQPRDKKGEWRLIQYLMRLPVPLPRHFLSPLCLLYLFWLASAQGSYTMEHTVNCNNINNDWTLSENLSYLWNIVVLHDIDRYSFLIGSPVIMFLQIVLIFSLCKYKLYQSTPMDIILACFISQFFINLCFFLTAIYYTVFSISDPMPPSFPAFCLTTAIVNSTFSILEKIYLLYFLFFIIFNVKKSIKKNKWFERNSKHIIPIVISVGSAIGIGVFDWYGLTQFGFCSTASTRNNEPQVYFPIVSLTFAVGFVVFAVIAYRYFKQHMPEGVALNRRKYEQNELMSRFVIGMSIILALFSIAMLAIYVNCLNPKPLMLIWATIFNFAKLIEFLYLIFVMLSYKKIGNKVKKLFRGLFSKSNVKSSITIGEKRLTQKQLLDIIDIGIKEKILDIQEEENQIDFIRITQVMTILTGIKISYKEYLYRGDKEEYINDLKNLFFSEEISFQIGPQLIKEYEQQAYILPRLSLLRGKFTIFAPKIFGKLLRQDEVFQLWRSFDLFQNSNQLYHLVESDGGRSGEFFFFTSDNKYILKTINKLQFNFLLEYLQNFYSHYLTYTNTLITKIYGMFKIENKEINQHYYILLMKNISGCNREQISRTYDMKGSTDDRQILKGEEYEDAELVGSVVLKDRDFIHLQHQIEIDVTLAKELRKQLKIDTEFLRDLNIIDYSLLVMRVRWDRAPPNPSFWKRLNRIASTIDSHEFYHVSLIDFLQKWDLHKKSEQWWKKLFGKKDVSAQQPSVYQFRFMKFLQEITSCDSHRVTRELISRDKSSEARQTELVDLVEIDARKKNLSLFLPGTIKKEERSITQIKH